jgi:hypothetical protein
VKLAASARNAAPRWRLRVPPADSPTSRPTDEFCGGCGVSLRSSPPTSQPKFSSPQFYTPKHLAEKILTSKSALEGERKLFADLKGSMELLADRGHAFHRFLDPEEVGPRLLKRR